jgi:hypothetical protein
MYQSSAVLRVDVADSGFINRRAQTALTRHSLTNIIYERERERRPLEEIVERMRRDIRISPAGPMPDNSAIMVAFAYPERAKVQQATRQLVSLISAGTPPFEVLDPPNLPVRRSIATRSRATEGRSRLGHRYRAATVIVCAITFDALFRYSPLTSFACVVLARSTRSSR